MDINVKYIVILLAIVQLFTSRTDGIDNLAYFLPARGQTIPLKKPENVPCKSVRKDLPGVLLQHLHFEPFSLPLPFSLKDVKDNRM